MCTVSRAVASVPDYTRLEFGAARTDRPYVIVNMVSSIDGRTVIGRTERGLGSAADQRLMRELRYHADVVLSGAETLRVSGASSRLDDAGLEARRVAEGRSALPVASTISRSGSLPLDSEFFTARDFEAVVYLSDAAPPAQRASIEATGRRIALLPRGDEVRGMLRHMRDELGAGLLLVEGGSKVTGAFFELGCIDEFFLTMGAVLVGGAEPKTVVSGAAGDAGERLARFNLLSAAPNWETDEVYLRYRRRTDEPDQAAASR